jgi:acyl carrier protein
MDDNLKLLLDTVNDVMSIDLSKLDPESKFAEISSWDSFNNLMLISKMEDIFKVHFTAQEIENTKKVKDLYELIKFKTKKR